MRWWVGIESRLQRASVLPRTLRTVLGCPDGRWFVVGESFESREFEWAVSAGVVLNY